MKFAISVITPEVQGEAPLALLEGTFEERLQKAAAIGYQGVELVVSDPLQLDPRMLLDRLTHYGLEPAAVATGFVFGSRGLRLVDPDPFVCCGAAELLQDLVRLAAAVGAKVVTIGGFRGKAEPVGGLENAKRILCAGLREADSLAQELGITIALEPLRRGESDLLNNAQEVCDLIHEGGFGAVRLLLDVYHMAEEPNMLEAFRKYRDRFVHVHLADTDRKALGLGSIDFSAIEAVLQEVGYTGWQSVELPRADDPDGNGRLPAYLAAL